MGRARALRVSCETDVRRKFSSCFTIKAPRQSCFQTPKGFRQTGTRSEKSKHFFLFIHKLSSTCACTPRVLRLRHVNRRSGTFTHTSNTPEQHSSSRPPAARDTLQTAALWSGRVHIWNEIPARCHVTTATTWIETKTAYQRPLLL